MKTFIKSRDITDYKLALEDIIQGKINLIPKVNLLNLIGVSYPMIDFKYQNNRYVRDYLQRIDYMTYILYSQFFTWQNNRRG